MTRRIEEGAVGVGVGEVGGQKVLVAELLENHFGHEQLLIRERKEVQHWEGFRRPYRNPSPACHLTIRMPPETEQSQRAVAPHSEGIVKPLVVEYHIRPSCSANAYLFGKRYCQWLRIESIVEIQMRSAGSCPNDSGFALHALPDLQL